MTKMFSLRAASVLRKVTTSMPKRNLAIMPTVKAATDTSSLDFPAPSHVSLSSEAASLARQIAAFYDNPDSIISLTEEARAALQSEIAKKVKNIPDSALPDNWAALELQVPSDIRLGDNPLFESNKKHRNARKID